MDSVYSINIERAVLSSILFNPEELEDVLGVLKPKDFYLPAHQKIFEVMIKLHDLAMPIDEEFIRKRVDPKDVDDSILLEILSANPITNTLAYVREIKDGSVKRELTTLATTIKKVSLEEETSANDALDVVQSELYKISTDSATSELKHMETITTDTLSYIEKMKKLGNQHLTGKTTGFFDLDKRTTGFNEGDLIILAARPAMGKCLGRGTKVLMYDGTLKNVEDVKVGDQLMGDDSTPRNVLSTTSGTEQMYWVRQNKGIDYRVNESHILSLKNTKNEVLNINIKEFLEKDEEFKKDFFGYKANIFFDKSNKPSLKKSDNLNLSKIIINKDIVDEYFGFEIDGNKLFLLEDMTVTHNTALVLNMALANVEAGNGVIFFSLEMPAEQLMLRMLAAKTSIPLQNLRKGDMDDKQWTDLTNAFEDLNTKKLFVDDGGSVNINQLRARVRKLAQNEANNISMVVIDYLQLMQGTGNKDRHQEVSDISRGLKMLAREMKIPIIALSQLNRGLENRPDKRPMLSDLRESGAIEQDADIIMFVYRDDVYKEREEARKEKEAQDKGEEYKSKFVNKPVEEAEIIIGKQRNGPIGTVKLDFQKQYTRFVNKDNPNEAPIEVVFESISDSGKETQIDVPDIL